MGKEFSERGKDRRRDARSKEMPDLQTFLDRLPPYNLEAEKNVVGAILLDPETCNELALILRPDDFHSESLKRIYRQLLNMHSSGNGIDLMLLVQQLRESGELEEIGGEAFLGEIMQSVQVVAHAVQYAKIVRDQAIRRDMIRTSSVILRDAYEPEIPSRELLAKAEERVMAIGDSRNSNQVWAMDDVIQQVFRIMEARADGAVDGVETGFIDLDRLLGGLHKSELIILAARPSMGKTALATNIADYVAVMGQHPVLFMSLEMSRQELAVRMLCGRGRIKGDRFRSSYLSEKELQSFTKVASVLSNAPLFIDDSSSRTVTEIGSVARRIQRQSGLDLIVIDYLGLIEPDNPSDPRQEQVAKIARRLKGLARELQVPVLCLAQLNRQTEASKDNRPRLSHLRESGAIEQDADVVMFVHREEYYHTSEEADDKQLKGVAEIIVAKQRNGPVGDIKLAWQSEYTLFSNISNNDGVGEYSDEFDDFAPTVGDVGGTPF